MHVQAPWLLKSNTWHALCAISQAKEKFSESWKFAVITVVVDFTLILAIMMNLEYPWYTDPKLP